MKTKIKNPCPICGRKTDSQGWCGARDHDAGNPYGGIVCFVGEKIHLPESFKQMQTVEQSTEQPTPDIWDAFD